MCGRFARRGDPKRLAKEFNVAEVPKVEARYNVRAAARTYWPCVSRPTGGR